MSAPKNRDVALVSEFMNTLRDDYGFDTIATRAAILDSLRSPTGQRFLDVGTGSGWMAIVAVQRGYGVVSMDLDANGLVRAEKRARQAGQVNRIRFVRADAVHMPFRDDHFPVVVSFDVVHHFENRLCPAVIDEMVRVCARGGDVVIADLNSAGIEAVQSVHERSDLIHEKNRCDVDEIENMIQATGIHADRRDLSFVSLFHCRK